MTTKERLEKERLEKHKSRIRPKTLRQLCYIYEELSKEIDISPLLVQELLNISLREAYDYYHAYVVLRALSGHPYVLYYKPRRRTADFIEAQRKISEHFTKLEKEGKIPKALPKDEEFQQALEEISTPLLPYPDCKCLSCPHYKECRFLW